MNHVPIPVSRQRVVRPAVPAREENRLRWHTSFAALRRIVATWEKRARFRRDVEQVSRHDPHLIDDIGLTRRQVEIEIAKHFWQA
ncbi:DUF1127 domain-containing protein [Ensifer sesbaniae]|uniref:DUF1127 domain-containing protein n=1 Tax=Ensifer sesbaniae TaxID=1214071 RepID=UPI002001A562|nr:DUF1127 domain-containing protein [Ensifer sesbaniae]